MMSTVLGMLMMMPVVFGVGGYVVGVPTTMSTPNGQRSQAPAVIADNPSDLLESPRLPGKTSPGGPAGNDGDAEKPALTPDVSTPNVPARTLGSTRFAEFGRDRLSWTQRQRRRRSR